MLVPAGEFTMGSDSGNAEKPGHTVYLDTFWIDQAEVTNTAFRAFVEATGGSKEMPAALDADVAVHARDQVLLMHRPADQHELLFQSLFALHR